MTTLTLSPTLNADLHCHSVVSDGTQTPEWLAERAHANGVQLWALTDHDELYGIERAASAAAALGLRPRLLPALAQVHLVAVGAQALVPLLLLLGGRAAT